MASLLGALEMDAAGQLRRVPPDLTTFATRNGGVFPSERVRQVIDGTGIAAHGDREMPVWGDVFKPHGDRSSQDATRQRIEAIIKFLESIQRRQA